MLDRQARRVVAPVLDAAGSRVAALGIRPLWLTAAGWIAGIGACAAAAASWWAAALVLWLLNRLLDGLDGPVARRRGATDLGGFLDIVADFTVYAGFVVGIALAVPDARLACVVLLAAYYASGTAFLALSSLLERRGGDADFARNVQLARNAQLAGDGRSLRFVGGIAEGTETVLAYVLFCLFPAHVTGLAWVFAALVFITAGQRVWLAVALLRPRSSRSTPVDVEKSR